MADPASVRIVDEEFSLVPYYPNEKTALPWYQDPDEAARSITSTMFIRASGSTPCISI